MGHCASATKQILKEAGTLLNTISDYNYDMKRIAIEFNQLEESLMNLAPIAHKLKKKKRKYFIRLVQRYFEYKSFQSGVALQKPKLIRQTAHTPHSESVEDESEL